MKPKTLEGIDRALDDGKLLRAFTSGGGLRVVRIEDPKGEPLRAYGEHPNLMPALLHASVDYLAGGRPYNEVYGKSEPHYLTGTTQPDDRLDLWVLGGHKLRAEKVPEGVKVEAKNWSNKPLASAVGRDFKTAYASLCDLLTDDVFKEADKLSHDIAY